MRLTFAMSFLSLILALVPTSGMTQERNTTSKGSNDNAKVLSSAEREAVKLAIIDEIYANHLQGHVVDVGKNISDSKYEVVVYFKPIISDKRGWVIYKLMPYGEVLRMFTLRGDGLAVLYGKLRDRFPPTQPSYLTVYMDDDELCRLKTDWLKSSFIVETKPEAARVSAAKSRGLKRNE